MSNRVFEAEEVVQHNSPKDLYMVFEGKVYDVTSFAEDHPGGLDILLDYGGQDCTKAYRDVGHSAAADELLQEMYIGDLKPGAEERLFELRQPRTEENDAPSIFMILALILVPALAVIGYMKFKG
ncbi:cytochrome b5 [Schizosaccharomyces octosporus yFS286]|uniref:Cytochrome b5 n=1 Tax=Schizosaccharomyces octosporus (strain yFS286) TaxID=483514 RepID=S9QVW3_SCHOY|nr:cytochrome b5 [Schizosaccharomyces octosporus yFS286]EPX70470.1 cytochrome b5 [Schizosaccharomyces octosporus yFS286]